MSNKSIAEAARHYVTRVMAVNESDGTVLLAAISDRDMAWGMLLKELGYPDPFATEDPDQPVRDTPPL